MNPSYFEKLDAIYGVHSPEAKRERAEALARIRSKEIKGIFKLQQEELATVLTMRGLQPQVASDHAGKRGAVMMKLTREEFDAVHAMRASALLGGQLLQTKAPGFRQAALWKTYTQGQVHGFGYGFICGTLAAVVAGLLLLGIKVGP